MRNKQSARREVQAPAEMQLATQSAAPDSLDDELMW
jgi:hypothetical protein